MALHDRIKEARKNAGMTQTELGERIGVAKTTIAGYEKNREPTAAQLGTIADTLNVDVTFLLQDEIKQRHDLMATPHEMEHLVKKYRALDEYGQDTVDAVLEYEYKRCQKQAQTTQKPATHFFRLVASDGTFKECYLTDEESAALEEEHRTAERATGI